MPSLLPEIAAPQRRTATTRAARPAEDEPERFSSHLTDSTQRRATSSRQPAPRETAAEPPAKPNSETSAQGRRTDKAPAHASTDRSQPRAAGRSPDRGPDRASEKAPINQEAESSQPDGPDNALSQTDTGDAASIALSSAAAIATDTALTVEACIVAGTADDSEADKAAEKNDSAVASTDVIAVPFAASVITDVAVATDSAPAPDGDTAIAAASVAGRMAGPARAAAAADGAPAAGPTDSAGSEPAAKLVPASLAAAVAKPEPVATGHGAHKDSQQVSTVAQATVAPADMMAGPKPHDPLSHGLQVQLQPVSDLATQPAAQASLPAKAPDAVPVQAVPIAIGLKALDGAREFEIRLDPAELGRVDVKLSISEDGRVQASLVVDRVETLALLQRDARTLERAFDQAGLTADANSIQFSLRQDSSDGQRNARDSFDDSGAASRQPDTTPAAPAIERPAQLYRGFVRETAVDIRV